MDPRAKKQARKMGDLQILGQLLQIADRYSPGQQAEDSLKQEQLAAAIEQRGYAPMRARAMETQVGGAEDQRRMAGELHPLQLADLQSQTAGRQEDVRFARESFQPRMDALTAGVKGQQLQNQGQEAVLPYLGQSAFLDNALKQNQSSMFPLQKEAMRAGTQATLQQTQQERDMFPNRQQATAMSMFGQASQVNPFIGGAIDIPKYGQQLGLQLPMAEGASSQTGQAALMEVLARQYGLQGQDFSSLTPEEFQQILMTIRQRGQMPQ